MVFNEILIPQDPFTETNVTRKRSVVENLQLSPKIIFLFKFHILFFYAFIMLENMMMNNMLEQCIK